MTGDEVRNHAAHAWAVQCTECNDSAAVLAAVAPLYDHLPDGMDMGEWVGRLVGLWAAVHQPDIDHGVFGTTAWAVGWMAAFTDLRQVGSHGV